MKDNKAEFESTLDYINNYLNFIEKFKIQVRVAFKKLFNFKLALIFIFGFKYENIKNSSFSQRDTNNNKDDMEANESKLKMSLSNDDLNICYLKRR